MILFCFFVTLIFVALIACGGLVCLVLLLLGSTNPASIQSWATETLFGWRFAGGPIVVRFLRAISEVYFLRVDLQSKVKQSK